MKKTLLTRKPNSLNKNSSWKSLSKGLQGTKKGLNKSGKLSTRKPTEEQQIVRKEQREKDIAFYLGIWNSRERKCVGCDQYLYGEISTGYFDHLLPKSKYPELRYEVHNIAVVCLQCHSCKESGFAKKGHQVEIDRAKVRFNV